MKDGVEGGKPIALLGEKERKRHERAIFGGEDEEGDEDEKEEEVEKKGVNGVGMGGADDDVD